MVYRISKLVATFAFLLLTSTSGATTWLVPADQPTIAAGLAVAVFGDTVQVAPGTYFEHGLVMADGVVLRGETGHHADVVIDAQQLGRVLFCDYLGPGTAVEDLTITGGFSDGDGFDALGGGVIISHSTLRFSGCAIVGNYAQVGGGMSLRNDADVLFEDCVFRENTAVSSGGGLRISQSAPVLRRCQFIDNVAEMDGAGIFSGSSGILIEDCLFQGNEAGIWGGALVLMSPNEGDLVVRGCTLVDNSAVYSGSAVFSGNECPFSLENCIVVGNRESEALYILDAPAYVALTCCNVFGNGDGDYGGTLVDQTGLNGNISLTPIFCDPAAGDFSLSADSPCLPDHNECGVLMGAFGMGCDISDVPTPSAPTRVLAVYPNPFNPRTTISVTFERAESAEIGVYDLTGRRVAVLANRTFTAGSHPLVWDGRDATGRTVPSGIYIARLDVDGIHEVIKLSLVR